MKRFLDSLFVVLLGLPATARRLPPDRLDGPRRRCASALTPVEFLVLA